MQGCSTLIDKKNHHTEHVFPIHPIYKKPIRFFRCPPCGCGLDHMRFTEPGICKHCEMPLVPANESFAEKIDRWLTPYFKDNILGTVYTKLIYPFFLLGLMFTLFQIAYLRSGKHFNLFLVGIVGVLSLYGFKNQLYGVRYSLTSTNESLFTPISFILALGPLIYFYIQSTVNPYFVWKKKYLWHFIPAILMAIYYSVLFPMPKSIKIDFMISPFEVLFSHSEQFITVTAGLMYMYFAHRSFLRRQKEQTFSASLIGWIKRFLIGMSVLLVFWGSIILMNYWLYDFGITTVTYNPLWAMMGAILSWLGLEISLQPHLFYPPKPKNSSQDKELQELAQYKIQLESLMQEDKIYRDPSLNLSKLAKRLNTNAKYISLVLNNAIGKNFYEYVNEYRVEEVKTLLTKPENKNLTIEAIANQAGFKSKSSFNAAFKKQTGMTPRQYTRQQTTMNEI